MYELTIYESVHAERVARVEAFADEQDAVKLLHPVRRVSLARVRTLLTTLFTHTNQPRRRAPLASS